MQEFQARYKFPFDKFQTEAIAALDRGESVLVTAPTGAGKTVVGEYAVWHALCTTGKVFYTTPLKALSNQKYNDFVEAHGRERVGLLTGDNSIRPDAPLVVMTTEVLRNMIYERSSLLADLRYVVLDEVHYLQDRYRGAVWEEVIIQLPLDVKIVCLSATVSNAEEFASWIQTVRGATSVISEAQRPVELKNHFFLNNQVLPMFARGAPNPTIRKAEAAANEALRGRNRRRRFPPPVSRTDIALTLSSAGMLPALYFIFSRKGCEAARRQCMTERFMLTNADDRGKIERVAEKRCSYLEDEDLDVLDFIGFLEALKAGVATHHAGMIPAFKETVEELFQAGLVKIVFATETLSLGINMPARTVVIESLTKFTGERHEMLTAGQYTQLTGRAGRRGIDPVGHAVVPKQRDMSFLQVTSLATSRSHPLVSSFQPSYNMAANLIRNYNFEEAKHLLNSSFAQFQSNKEVVIWEKQVERDEAYLASYREKMRCSKADFAQYWTLVEKARGTPTPHKGVLRHPCHSCPDRDKHAQFAARAARLQRDLTSLQRRIRSGSSTVSRRFEDILDILRGLGYVESFTLTHKGRGLSRIYNENDLLLAETLSKGWMSALDEYECAALASVFVFESRGPDAPSSGLPTAAVKTVYGRVVRLSQRLRRTEGRARLELTRGPDAGFAIPVYRWGKGDRFEDVIDDQTTPGDFIRSCKQTIDLLRQIAEATPALAAKMRSSSDLLSRGVVAYSGAVT